MSAVLCIRQPSICPMTSLCICVYVCIFKRFMENAYYEILCIGVRVLTLKLYFRFPQTFRGAAMCVGFLLLLYSSIYSISISVLAGSVCLVLGRHGKARRILRAIGTEERMHNFRSGKCSELLYWRVTNQRGHSFRQGGGGRRPF